MVGTVEATGVTIGAGAKVDSFVVLDTGHVVAEAARVSAGSNNS